jgi:hypothetical protein
LRRRLFLLLKFTHFNTMKNIITNSKLSLSLLLMAMVITTTNLQADIPEWIWAVQGGGVNYNSGREIVTDEQGNIYVTGFYQGTGTFGDQSVTSAGSFDAFVVKYDHAGNALWARSLGSENGDYGIGLAIDAGGNIYVTGYFSGTMTTSVGTFTSLGLRDIYLAKFSNDGDLLWVRHAGSPGMNEGNGVAVDNINQQVYVTGKFEGTLIFVDTPETLVSAGASDIMVAAYSFDGALIWAKRAGGTENEISFALGTDGAGNVYGTANMNGTATFGDFTLTSFGLGDIVVFKLDPDGGWLWAKNYGAAGEETGWDIAVDDDGNNWVTGVFSSPSIAFGDHIITNTNIMQDMFVFKQNADGDVLWANSGGGASNDYGRGIAIDEQGACFVTGDYQGTANFGPHQLTAVHNVDIFIVKYAPDGSATWVKSAGGQSTDSSNAIDTDNEGNLFVTGYFYNNMIFDNLSLAANYDQPVFVAKLKTELQTNILQATAIGGSIAVFPNPAETVVYLQNEKGQPVNVESLQIINAVGMEVMAVQGNSFNAINISSLNAGIYFVIIQTNGQTSTARFVKK